MLDTTVRVLLEEDPEGMLQAGNVFRCIGFSKSNVPKQPSLEPYLGACEAAQNDMDTGIPMVGKHAETHRAKVFKRYRSIVDTWHRIVLISMLKRICKPVVFAIIGRACLFILCDKIVQS